MAVDGTDLGRRTVKHTDARRVNQLRCGYLGKHGPVVALACRAHVLRAHAVLRAENSVRVYSVPSLDTVVPTFEINSECWGVALQQDDQAPPHGTREQRR